MKKEIKFRAFLDDGIVQKSHGAQKLNVVQFASSLKLKKNAWWGSRNAAK